MQIVGKMIPLSEYKQPILKLTSEDKKQIRNIQNQIRRWQYRLNPLEAELNTPWVSEAHKQVLRGKIQDIIKEIGFLHGEIRNVKINRHEQQLLETIA